MDKKLFNENLLTKNLSKNIVKEIEKIDSSIDPKLFEIILNSEELSLFIKSLKAPKYVEETKHSVLLQNIKNIERLKKNTERLKIKSNKKQSKKNKK